MEDFFAIHDIINCEYGTVLLNITAIMLFIVCVKLVNINNLLENIILLSVFSSLISLCYLLMDAPDVAMTEVALGACISSCVLLNFYRILNVSQNMVAISNKKIVGFIISSCFVVIMIYAVRDLPEYGLQNNPLHINASHYINNTRYEMGISSLTAALLAGYRGYDTLGETAVILIAGIGVLIAMPTHNSGNVKTLNKSPIIRLTTYLILPYICLYALYIHFNGENSPGGGFQAGVILASSIIGLDLVCDKHRLHKLYHSHLLLLLAAVIGVIIYASVGVACMILGGNFLDYSRLALDPVLGQKIGISIVELGVGITVASAMCLIYFTRRDS